ncbi:MAG: hypothetical protein AAF399_29635 [Bacteroidota bacterium]
MFQFAKRSLLILLGVMLLAACGKPSFESIAYPQPYEGNELMVQLSPTQEKYDLDEPILLRFTITNQTGKTVRIPRAYSPLEDRFTTDYFHISRKKHRVFYKAQRLQRLPYLSLSKVKLKAGESISAVVDIREGYTIEKSGKYRVQFMGSHINRLPDSEVLEIKIK